MKNSDGLMYHRQRADGSAEYAWLRFTLREGAGYRWVQCLALLDRNGRWMYSGFWRATTRRRNMTAEREVERLGWKPCDCPHDWQWHATGAGTGHICRICGEYRSPTP